MKTIVEEIDEVVDALWQPELSPSEDNSVFTLLSTRIRFRELKGLCMVCELTVPEIEGFVKDLTSNRKLFSVGRYWLCSTHWPSEDETSSVVYHCSSTVTERDLFVWKPKLTS